MEMQNVAMFSSRWSESSDLQTEILARLPVEFVYRYRITCKQWNEFLSSSYFLTKWAEAPLNGQQPRLVLCSANPRIPSMAFCFYTRTWIKSFTFSFLEDWIPHLSNYEKVRMHSTRSVGGLILATGVDRYSKWSDRLCNPYTRAFVDIPWPQTGRYHTKCIVVDENNNQKSDNAYKIVSFGHFRPGGIDANFVPQSQLLEIYEPSQKTWNIAGYFPLDLILNPCSQLVFCNGLFYTHSGSWMVAEETKGIVCFTMPIEKNGSDAAAKAIPLLSVPFPERNGFLYGSPWMITCGSRLLLVGAKYMPPQSKQDGGEGEQQVNLWELNIILWELRIEERHPVRLSNSSSWKWVEIARMPSLLCRNWMKKFPCKWEGLRILSDFCIGVGDYVCFVPAFTRSYSKDVVEVVAYNLRNNEWNRLPACHKTHSCLELGAGRCDHTCDRGSYTAIPFLPSPHRNV